LKNIEGTTGPSYRQKWITDILGRCTTQNSRRNDCLLVFVETVALNTATNTIAEAARKGIGDFPGTTVIAKVAKDVIEADT